MLIDTHCHLYLEQFESDLHEVIGRAHEVKVEKIILPNIDSKTVGMLKRLYQSDEKLFDFALGLHPTSVTENYQNELELIFEDIRNVIAIGEIGIDMYWDQTFLKQQKEAFDWQINFAITNDLPIIIHCRNSFKQIIDVLKIYKNSDLNGVFHCFSENYKEAAMVLDMGFNIGIGGVLTYKNSNLKELLPKIPINNIVLETDAPYLSPTPKRGKRNEPAYVKYVAEFISELLCKSFSEVCETTTLNAKKIFKIN